VGEDKRLNEKQTTGLHDFFFVFCSTSCKIRKYKPKNENVAEKTNFFHIFLLGWMVFFLTAILIGGVACIVAREAVGWMVGAAVRRLRSAQHLAACVWKDPGMNCIDTSGTLTNSFVLSKEVMGWRAMSKVLAVVGGLSKEEEMPRVLPPLFMNSLTCKADFPEHVLGVLDSGRVRFESMRVFSHDHPFQSRKVAAVAFEVDEGLEGKCMHVGFVDVDMGLSYGRMRSLDPAVYGTDALMDSRFVDFCDHFMQPLKAHVREWLTDKFQWDVRESSSRKPVYTTTTVRLYGRFNGAGLAVLAAMAMTSGHFVPPVASVILYTEGCPRIASTKAKEVLHQRHLLSNPRNKGLVLPLLPALESDGKLYGAAYEFKRSSLIMFNVLSKHDPVPNIANPSFCFHSFPILLDTCLQDVMANEPLSAVEARAVGADLWYCVSRVHLLPRKARTALYDRMFRVAFCEGGFSRLHVLLFLRGVILDKVRQMAPS
jgi:hypothetical protein